MTTSIYCPSDALLHCFIVILVYFKVVTTAPKQWQIMPFPEILTEENSPDLSNHFPIYLHLLKSQLMKADLTSPQNLSTEHILTLPVPSSLPKNGINSRNIFFKQASKIITCANRQYDISNTTIQETLPVQ